MTPEQFAYWMQGFCELGGATLPTAAQWTSIQEHLATVFYKVTREMYALPLNAKTPLPPLDLRDNESIKKLLEEARNQGGVAYPVPAYTPGWVREGGGTGPFC